MTNTNLATVIPFYREKSSLHSLEVNGTEVRKFIKKPAISTKMECLYNEEQIRLVDKVETATTTKKEKVAMRNLTMYICGINIGLRAGDFCSLKWCQVFDQDWNVKKKETFVPEKTTKKDEYGNIFKRKLITLRYDSDFRMAIINWYNWLVEHDEKPELDDYIFPSNKNECMTEKSWYKVMETTRKEAGIKQKIGTHGLRKTYGHSYYLAAKDKSQALVQLMMIFGHSDMRITLAYICISDEEIFENQERMCVFSNGEDDFMLWNNKIEESIYRIH